MAKANLTLPNGTTVAIEGSAEEVAALLERFSGGASSSPPEKGRDARKRPRSAKSAPTKSGRMTPQRLIAALAEENYFKAKRTISDIQKKLEEAGHIYALHSLSTPLLRLTRQKVLRRIKEKTGWVYVS